MSDGVDYLDHHEHHGKEDFAGLDPALATLGESGSADSHCRRLATFPEAGLLIMPNVGPLEIIVVLAIGLIVLGPKRLPELAGSLGRGMREFRTSLAGASQESPATKSAAKPEAAPETEAVLASEAAPASGVVSAPEAAPAPSGAPGSTE